MDVKTDIDIDFYNRGPALEGLRHVVATDVRQTERRRHVSGVYFHDVPTDPLDGLAVWDFREAEEKGYFKLDFLHNTIYKNVRDESHLVELLTTEPPWDLFLDQDIIRTLAHVAEHLDVITSVKPRSILDLAVCIALPRPGKRHLIGRPRSEIDKEIWLKSDKYYFKKSHAVAYAASIVVQLNLMIEEANGS